MRIFYFISWFIILHVLTTISAYILKFNNILMFSPSRMVYQVTVNRTVSSQPVFDALTMCLKGDFLNAARTCDEISASLCLCKVFKISSKSTSTCWMKPICMRTIFICSTKNAPHTDLDCWTNQWTTSVVSIYYNHNFMSQSPFATKILWNDTCTAIGLLAKPALVSNRHTSNAFALPRRRVDPSMNSVKVICPSPLSMNSNKLSKSWYSSSSLSTVRAQSKHATKHNKITSAQAHNLSCKNENENYGDDFPTPFQVKNLGLYLGQG